MAKYVGKIFKVNNKALKIKGSGTHYVHVKWYNPFTRKFRCNIITSLENKKELDENQRRNLHLMTFSKEKRNSELYYVFNRQKYNKLRNGKIVPIPFSKTQGFEVWSGYSDVKNLHISSLKNNEQKHMKIKK